ncbi:MAG: RecX family transcriptional regulator [Cellulosilyticaceae bacterium]
MYKITAIEIQRKDETRSSVFINDVFSFGASTKAIERYGLAQGMVLTEEAYGELLVRLQLDKAKYTALNYLSTQNKTEKQVTDKLIEKEYSIEIVEEVLTFLKKYGYVDDELFTRRYVESKARYGKKSARYIQSQLYMKGISGCNVFEAWEGLEEAEIDNILYFLQKYKFDKALPYENKRKIINRLLNKGFTYERIQKSIGNLDESFEV